MYRSYLCGTNFVNWDTGITRIVAIQRVRAIGIPLRVVQRAQSPDFFLPGRDLSDSKTFWMINPACPARSVLFAG